MSDGPESPRPEFEARLDQLRRQAAERPVEAPGVRARGGPMPPMPEDRSRAGYHGLPVLKPPVWKWMIGLYFFVGGLAGMSALLAVGAMIGGRPAITRAAMWPAAIGAILSPALLIWDLGRPWRFLNMLRVLKVQSPMS